MEGNKAVAYKGPGKVEVIDIDYPSFELKDGPGVNPANVGGLKNRHMNLIAIGTGHRVLCAVFPAQSYASGSREDKQKSPSMLTAPGPGTPAPGPSAPAGPGPASAGLPARGPGLPGPIRPGILTCGAGLQ